MALFRRRRPSVQGPSTHTSPHSYHPIPVRQPDRGPALVTADQMTVCPALHRAMQALSGFVAGLPVIDLDTNKPVDTDPDSDSFYVRPTGSGLTWFEFIDAIMTDRIMHGNCIAVWTGVDRDGQPNRCELVHPNYVTPLEERWTQFQPCYSINGEMLSFPDVMHFRGWMRAGYSWGVSPLRVLASMISVQLSEQAYARATYEDGARVPGYLSTPKQADPTELAEVAEAFAAAVGGRGSGVVALGDGLEWKSMDLQHADVAMLKAREFSQQEACMVIGVPPHLIGAAGPANSSMKYSNLTMDLRAFRSLSLNRHVKHLEQTFQAHGFRIRFALDEAVQPPAIERWETYKVMLQTGAVSVEQVCEMEGLPPPPEPEPHVGATGGLGSQQGEGGGGDGGEGGDNDEGMTVEQFIASVQGGGSD